MSKKEKNIDQLEKKIKTELDNFTRELETVKNLIELDKIRAKYIGKKSFLIKTLKNIGDLPDDIKPIAGKKSNTARNKIESDILKKEKIFKNIEYKNKLRKESIDLSLPGRSTGTGRKNIISQVVEEIEEIFIGMGFEIAEGPEVETDYYNFEALNMEPDHPARDMWSTLYISGPGSLLLRTHTSPVQIRVMEKQAPPVRIIAPGKVYRHDLDISHAPMFHQVEGLWVDKEVTFSDLKGSLSLFLEQMFAPDIGIRFRPSFFPFTEPSMEVDIACVMCKGKGCRLCKGTGWIEILGAGMVNPKVLKNVGYDPEEMTGYAFGMGVERIAMLKYGIDDIRLFSENDLRFLRQF